MRRSDHRLCVLCEFYTSMRSLIRPPPDSAIKMIEIRTWPAVEGLEELDMKKEIESKFPGISVSNGMYICSLHVQKLPEGQCRFSKYCRPKLTTEYDGLYWSTPTTRPLPVKRCLPPPATEPPAKRLKTDEEVRLLTENLDLKQKMEEMSEKLRLLEEQNKYLEDKLERQPIVTPIDLILKDMDSETCMEWYGVSSFGIFHATIMSYLRNYRGLSYDRKRQLERFLIQLRNGFTYRVALPLLEPTKSASSFMNLFRHTLNDLFPWALEQIQLPTVDEWRRMNTEQMAKDFPGFLSFFVDGTVIEIWNPKDVKKYRENFNSKHGHTAMSFFVVCTPDGCIVYLSKFDTGSTHDSTAWNTALAWPPITIQDGKCVDRPDRKLFVKQLEEVYGEGLPEAKKVDRSVVERESNPTFSIGGDKAYPFIHLPSGWSLFVTMTAGEERAISDASDAVAETEKIYADKGVSAPNFVHSISDDPRRHRDPRLAKSRAVVERVIGSMKEWKILSNISWVSSQSYGLIWKALVIIAALHNYNLRMKK